MINSGTSETRVFDEQSPSGNDYLAEVCREWEAAALRVDKDVRLALIRIGVVLGKEGGALGVINGTSPNPVRLSEMCDHLGSVLGRPSWLPVPDIALKAVLGEGACVVRSHEQEFFLHCKIIGCRTCQHPKNTIPEPDTNFKPPKLQTTINT
ncbi:hypothetical protein DH2020_023776 [Rehmannia glutinosa]|uniref:Uncharacterized protein n=1 Tax=Rehmannia glutinosa TaxID=99300 RepID=A0ABR0W6Z9_REHGL